MRIYAPSRMQSVKDLPGQTKLKFRCACVPAAKLVARLHTCCRPWLCLLQRGSCAVAQRPAPPLDAGRSSPAGRPLAMSRAEPLRSLGADALPASCLPLFSPASRQPGQNTEDDLRSGDLRSKLEEKERKHFLKTKSTNFEGAGRHVGGRRRCLLLPRPALAGSCASARSGCRPQQRIPAVLARSAFQLIRFHPNPMHAGSRGARGRPAATRVSGGSGRGRRRRSSATHAGAQSGGCRR